MNSRDIWGQVSKTRKQSYLDAELRMVEDSFDKNINYEVFYKNYNPSEKFEAWIYDESSERKDAMKKFCRMRPSQSIRQGEYIHWNNDIWICLGTDTQYENRQLGMIYQCLDDSLKWIDEYGYHEYAIYSSSKVLRDPLSDGRAVSLVEESMEAYIQKNEDTLRIIENMRFTFGTRSVFKVIEVLDFYIDNTIKILLKKDENRAEDDFVNGIAENISLSVYINNLLDEEELGVQKQLSSAIEIEGSIDDTKIVKWYSSNPSVATITESGYIEFLTEGSCTITADYNGVKTSKDIEVKTAITQLYSYIVSPEIYNIRIDREIEYTIEKYLNGVLVVDTYTIVDNTSDIGYEFEQTSNNKFRIKNISNKSLNVDIEINSTTDIINKTYSLRVW